MEQIKYIAYLRTDKQRGSKSEFATQLRIIKGMAKENNAKIIGVYREVADGSNPNRPELHKALNEQNKKANKGSFIASLTMEVLSQDILFVCERMLKYHPFILCESPGTDHFTYHILAIVAEHRKKNLERFYNHKSVEHVSNI